MQHDHHAELVTLLDLAMIPTKGETAVVDFVVELLKNLGYVRRERVSRTRVDLPFFICGENRHVKPDVCIVSHSLGDILLLVQKVERLDHGEFSNARAQLVAESVAAFNENNIQREMIELPPLAEEVSQFASSLVLF